MEVQLYPAVVTGAVALSVFSSCRFPTRDVLSSLKIKVSGLEHCASKILPFCLTLSLSVCLSVSLSVCLTICLTVLSLCVCLSVCVSPSLSHSSPPPPQLRKISPSLCLFPSPLSVCLLACLSACLSLPLSFFTPGGLVQWP